MAESCRICGSKNLRSEKISGTELLTCDNCGIYYLAAMPAKSSAENYYTKEYILSLKDELEKERRRIFRLPEQLFLISEIMKFKRPPAKILDIGCDRGYFLDEARRYGYDVSGIELAENAVSYLIKTGITNFRSFNEIGDKTDITVMWHSLEHFPEPYGILAQVRENLTHEGLLFIRVPDFGCFWRKILKGRWIWFQPQNHYFHYNLKSLGFLLARAGFEVLDIYSRRPNNIYTNFMHRMSGKIYRRYFGTKLNLKKILAQKYENITGKEVFAIVRKK